MVYVALSFLVGATGRLPKRYQVENGVDRLLRPSADRRYAGLGRHVFELERVNEQQGHHRLSDLDQMGLSFYAKGATTGKILSHLAAVYDARVSKNVISNATGTVGEKMQTERRMTNHLGTELCDAA